MSSFIREQHIQYPQPPQTILTLHSRLLQPYFIYILRYKTACKISQQDLFIVQIGSRLHKPDNTTYKNKKKNHPENHFLNLIQVKNCFQTHKLQRSTHTKPISLRCVKPLLRLLQRKLSLSVKSQCKSLIHHIETVVLISSYIFTTCW